MKQLTCAGSFVSGARRCNCFVAELAGTITEDVCYLYGHLVTRAPSYVLDEASVGRKAVLEYT
jgi:hypothetical protein